MAALTSGALAQVKCRAESWGDSCVLRARDDALADAGVRKGDYLVVRRGNVLLDVFLGGDEGVFGRKPWRSLTIPNAEKYRYVFPEAVELNGDGRSDILLHYRDWSEARDAVVLFLSKRK